MIEFIAKITLVASVIGVGAILFRKIPVLLTLPETFEQGESFISKFKKGFEKNNPFKDFSYEIFLEKVLRKIRILTLKTDNKTFDWLNKLREKVQKKKIEENDNYWKKIRKLTKHDKPA